MEYTMLLLHKRKKNVKIGGLDARGQGTLKPIEKSRALPIRTVGNLYTRNNSLRMSILVAFDYVRW
jgi:hypothetical protein